MRSLVLNALLLILISFKVFCQTDKIYDFDKYKVYIQNEKDTLIKIENKRKNKLVYYDNRKGDGYYSVCDTLNLGNDNITDFLLIDLYDDSFVVEALISEGDKFYHVIVGDFLPADPYFCSFQIDKYKRCYIQNGFVYINVSFDDKGRLVFMKCSRKISFQEILKLKK